MSPILTRAPRFTRAQLAQAEAEQFEVIERLRDLGEDSLAGRLERCQHARRHRKPGLWPFRCGSAGCWSCRRTTVRRWWRGFCQWLSDPEASLVTIPLMVTTDLIAEVRRLRKGLRDVRDRAARADPAWAAVAMGGMVGDGQLVLLIQHAQIERDALWAMLERRWREVIVSEVGKVEPHSGLSIDRTVQLARLRRGLEPHRVVVPGQVRADQQVQIDPMPIAI